MVLSLQRHGPLKRLKTRVIDAQQVAHLTHLDDFLDAIASPSTYVPLSVSE